jgi:hypothetical protein
MVVLHTSEGDCSWQARTGARRGVCPKLVASETSMDASGAAVVVGWC